MLPRRIPDTDFPEPRTPIEPASAATIRRTVDALPRLACRKTDKASNELQRATMPTGDGVCLPAEVRVVWWSSKARSTGSAD